MAMFAEQARGERLARVVLWMFAESNGAATGLVLPTFATSMCCD